MPSYPMVVADQVRRDKGMALDTNVNASFPNDPVLVVPGQNVTNH